MTRLRGMLCAALVTWTLAPGVLARADAPAPELGAGCPAELAEAMTLLADGTTYAICQQSGLGYSWVAPQSPFPPNDTWLSYGPAITLHGQAMRNPNLLSGQWTATPQDPESTCRVKETTVVEAGVLADPQIFEGEQGKQLSVQMLPKLFYAELAGNCLWERN